MRLQVAPAVDTARVDPAQQDSGLGEIRAVRDREQRLQVDTILQPDRALGQDLHRDQTRDARGKAGTPMFQTRGVPFVTLAFALAVVAAPGTDADSMLQASAAGSVVLAHGLGTVGALLLENLIDERHGRGFVSASPFVLCLAKRLEALPPIDRKVVDRFVARFPGQIARLCAMGPRHGDLPEASQERAVRAASAIDRVAEALGRARLVWLDDPGLEFVLRTPHL